MTIPLLQTIQIVSITSDPVSPANGTMWYNSTNNLLMACVNGVNVSLSGIDGSGSTSLPLAAGLAIALG